MQLKNKINKIKKQNQIFRKFTFYTFLIDFPMTSFVRFQFLLQKNPKKVFNVIQKGTHFGQNWYLQKRKRDRAYLTCSCVLNTIQYSRHSWTVRCFKILKIIHNLNHSRTIVLFSSLFRCCCWTVTLQWTMLDWENTIQCSYVFRFCLFYFRKIFHLSLWYTKVIFFSFTSDVLTVLKFSIYYYIIAPVDWQMCCSHTHPLFHMNTNCVVCVVATLHTHFNIMTARLWTLF